MKIFMCFEQNVKDDSTTTREILNSEGNCAALGYYSASSDNYLPTFRATYRSHLQERTPEDRTDR